MSTCPLCNRNRDTCDVKDGVCQIEWENSWHDHIVVAKRRSVAYTKDLEPMFDTGDARYEEEAA